jgi:3-methyladenine DNA glycosylase AlkD
MTPLATTVLSQLTEAYAGAADPEKAPAMRAYMRDQFDFLGIPNPERLVLNRRVLAGLDRPDETDLRDVALACWHRPEREYQYFACGWLRRHVTRATQTLLPTVTHLVTTKSWWDTVDTLAADTVGPMVQSHPELLSTMDDWVRDDNLWIARTAILHQLGYKQDTDAERLFRYCLAQAGHRDFFIRKAIGWALRQYARTNPEAVAAFLASHGERMSALSVREASKHL